MLTQAAPAVGRSATGFVEHLTRHRDLGHLERDVSPMADNLAPILTSFSRKPVSDHGSATLGIARVRIKLPKL
jgi:hypothetical protein